MRPLHVLLSAVLLVFAAGCATTPQSASAPAAERQFDFEESSLDNGLRVVTLEDFSAPIVSVQVWYHVGAKNENPNRQGFAHMFEHMMFRGTENLGPEQHFALIRGVGGWCNAFTSFDYTAYVNTLPSNQLDLALWLEAERMMFLKVDQEGFDTERRVVEEERRMGLNQPYGAIFEQLMPVIFTEHPYRWLPIGKIDHLRAASLEELRHFWDTYYVPANATLVVSGAVSHEEARAAAEEYFGWIPNLPKPEGVTIVEPAQTEPREIVIKEKLGRVPLARYAYRGVEAADPDAVPLYLMIQILGGDESSRLNQDLVKTRQICQEAYAFMWDLEQDGMFFIGAELAQGGDMDTAPVFAAMDEHIARIAAEGVTQRELDKVRNQLLRSTVTGQLKVYDKANAIGQTAIDFGDPEWLNEKLAVINAVTVDDVQRVAQTYLKAEARTKVVVLPDPESNFDPDANVAMEAYTPPARDYVKAGITRPEGFPNTPPIQSLLSELPEVPFVERTLPNGLKVVVVPNDEVPFVTATLGLKYGAWTDAPGRPGAANLALSMLTKGTENFTSAELAETLAFNALTLGGSAEMDVASVSASALTEKLPLALELMAEAVLRPAFPEGELAILKEQVKNGLAISANDPGYIADRAVRHALYGGHPYSRSVAGELEDIDPITRADLQAWWSAYARPDASVLYIAGAVDAESAFELAESYLGTWAAQGAAPQFDLPAIPAAQPRKVYLVDMPGAVQSEIRLAHPSITRTDPEYHKTRVFTQIFGGAFNSRLNRVIRVERGLTYGARGYFRPARFSGEFLCSTFTKTESTAETVQAIVDVIEDMRKNPATPEEMTEAKAFLTGSFPEDLETPQDTVTYQWLIEYNGLPKDYLQQAIAAYNGAEIADMTRIAEDYIDLDNAAIVVCGDAAKVKDSLAPFGEVVVIAP